MAKKTAKKKTKKKTKNKTGRVSVTAAPDNKVPPVITPYPTAGRKIEEFEERLDRQLGDESPEKRGRGRPRKDEQPQPSEINITVIGQAVQIPFDLWSASQNVPELKITTNESILIAKPLKQLLDHYVPQVPEIAWAWISLAAVSYSIMKSRLELIAAIKKSRHTSETRTDAARGGKVPVSPPPTQGQGSPAPSAVFPNIKQVKQKEQ